MTLRSGLGNTLLINWAGPWSLAEFVTALKNVRPLRAMRAIGPRAAEFAIVIAVMAIGAEDLRAHQTSRCQAFFVEHIHQQARLRQGARTSVGHGMARCGSGGQFRNHVQRIRCGDYSHRRVAVD